MHDIPRLIITGASGQVGASLLSHLDSARYDTISISRKQQHNSMHKWLIMDLEKPESCMLPHAEILVHIAPITLLPGLLAANRTTGLKRIIAFSSTSIFVKHQSGNHLERKLIASMIESEKKVISMCGQYGINWTIFRPTLVYGRGQDKNVAVIAKFIEKCSFFPVAYKGRGLRQPVHADDLAEACRAVIDRPVTFNHSYNLSGGEMLSYREMVWKIFLATGKKPRIYNVPAWLYKVTIMLARQVIPQLAYINTSMVDRMKQDLIFDSSSAADAFGYNPRKFSP